MHVELRLAARVFIGLFCLAIAARAQFPECPGEIFYSGFDYGSAHGWTSNSGACPELEPNDTVGEATPACASQSGAINPVGDIDLFSVTMAWVRARLTFETNDGAVGSCAAIDTVITLFDSDGTTVLASDDESGVNSCSKTTYTPLPGAGGPFFIKVEEFLNNSVIAQYGLSATVETRSPNESEPNDSIATANPFCATYIGAILPIGDSDYVKFAVTSGQTIVTETHDGFPGTCAAPLDTVIELYDPSGALRDQDDQDGINSCSKITWLADSTGDWTVRTRHWNDSAILTMYGLNVTLTP